MTTRQQLEMAFLAGRELKIRRARADFWEFCKLLDPDNYKDSRWHMRLIAWVLQALYEKRLTKEAFRTVTTEIAPQWFVDEYDWDQLRDGIVYSNMMMNIPPRHFKSRTLVMFTEWCFGKNKTNRVITASYNEKMASDFARFTRDGIAEEKVYPHEIVYADVFPETKIAQGNASFMQWALEGQFFSYKGAGLGGSITGKGANILIVDDPVRDAAEAFNENALDKQWEWYTGTFLSRQEQRLSPIKIVNMTRWSKKDIAGRILVGRGGWRWFVLKIGVESKDGKHMLCDEILPREAFEELKETTDPLILQANYYQEPIDVQGLLYKEFKTYDRIPTDEQGNPLFEKYIAYGDTADKGADYLCVPMAGVYMGELYMLDVIYTQEGMEVTEPMTADALVKNNIGLVKIESNSGGRGFARNVDRLIWERCQTKKVHVEWFTQTKNKEARILSNSVYVMNHVHMPSDWRFRWPEYYKAMTEYQRAGKNKHDDAPDATTGLVEMMDYQPVVIEEPLTATYEDIAGDDGGLFDQLW